MLLAGGTQFPERSWMSLGVEGSSRRGDKRAGVGGHPAQRGRSYKGSIVSTFEAQCSSFDLLTLRSPPVRPWEVSVEQPSSKHVGEERRDRGVVTQPHKSNTRLALWGNAPWCPLHHWRCRQRISLCLPSRCGLGQEPNGENSRPGTSVILYRSEGQSHETPLARFLCPI